MDIEDSTKKTSKALDRNYWRQLILHPTQQWMGNITEWSGYGNGWNLTTTTIDLPDTKECDNIIQEEAIQDSLNIDLRQVYELFVAF